MGSNLAYAAASLVAALVAVMAAVTERFILLPIPAVQGSAAHAAARTGTHAGTHAAAHTTLLRNAVDRKADDWSRPRGRRL